MFKPQHDDIMTSACGCVSGWKGKDVYYIQYCPEHKPKPKEPRSLRIGRLIHKLFERFLTFTGEQ